MHLVPEKDCAGPLQRAARLHPAARLAGVKVVGDFYRNYERRPAVGARRCSTSSTRRPARRSPIIDASDITDMRTGAVTAIGARHLARADSKVLGHIGARGTAYWNVRLLHSIFAFDEIRVHSRRIESRDAFAARLRADLPGAHVVVTDDWESCVRGADIVVEASRLDKPAPLLKTEWIEKGACVIPYGTMSAVELSLTDIMDKIVMDDWGQADAGPFGALRAHVDCGRLSEKNLHAELGQIVAGLKPGPRERRRDQPVLAPRPVALGHRARRGDARQGEGRWASASRCAFADGRRRGCLSSTPACTRSRRGARPTGSACSAGPLTAPGSTGRRRPRCAGAARRSSGRATTSARR